MRQVHSWIYLGLLLLANSCSSVPSGSSDKTTELITLLSKNVLTNADVRFIQDNFEKGQEDLKKRAENTLGTESRFRWQSALSYYQRLNILGEGISKHKKHFPELEVVDYSNKIKELEEGMAEDKYLQAEEALSANNREGAKVAYFQLLEVQELVNPYKNTNELLEEARSMAEVPVLIFVDTLFGQQLDYDSLHNSFQPLIDSEGLVGPFVDFHFYSEFDPLDQVAHVATLRLESFEVGKMIVKEYTQEVENSSTPYQVEEYTQPLTFEFTIEIIETGLGQTLKSVSFPLAHQFKNTIGSYTGDRAALNDYQKSLLGQEVSPPSNEDLFRSVVPVIRGKAAGYLLDFYQNY